MEISGCCHLQHAPCQGEGYVNEADKKLPPVMVSPHAWRTIFSCAVVVFGTFISSGSQTPHANTTPKDVDIKRLTLSSFSVCAKDETFRVRKSSSALKSTAAGCADDVSFAKANKEILLFFGTR